MSTKKNILIIGDCMVDEYVICDHNRHSPEADVPLLNEIKRVNKLGGASNVAVNVNSLGSSAHIIGVVGNDASGDMLNSISKEMNLNAEYIVDANRPTTLKTRFVDQNFKQFLRLDNEISRDLDEGIQDKLMSKIEKKIAQHTFGAIIIQDYNKGVFSEEMIRFVQKTARKNNIKLFVDPKKNHFELLSQCYMFKPNIKECQSFLNLKSDHSNDETIRRITSILTSAENLIVTLGSEGIYYKSTVNDGFIKGWTVESADVSGAGDTVIAALCHFDLNGLSLEKSADLANKAGALSCSKKGISCIGTDELDNIALKARI